LPPPPAFPPRAALFALLDCDPASAATCTFAFVLGRGGGYESAGFRHAVQLRLVEWAVSGALCRAGEAPGSSPRPRPPARRPGSPPAARSRRRALRTQGPRAVVSS